MNILSYIIAGVVVGAFVIFLGFIFAHFIVVIIIVGSIVIAAASYYHLTLMLQPTLYFHYVIGDARGAEEYKGVIKAKSVYIAKDILQRKGFHNVSLTPIPKSSYKDLLKEYRNAN